MVDAGTGLVELALIPTANSNSCATPFHKQWLCSYPRPMECEHDNGNKFTGEKFQKLLVSYDIKSKPTIVKNSHA